MTTDPLYATPASNVLCPGLYNKLASVIHGEVLVANQGVSGITQSGVQADGSMRTTIVYAGEYYRVNCPFCNDTRHRLWVSHMYGQPDARGKSMRFLAHCYNENCLQNLDNRRTFENAILQFHNGRTIKPFAISEGEWIDPQSHVKAEAPGEMIPMVQLAQVNPSHPAVQYMCGVRRYTPEMLRHYEVAYCQHSSKYPLVTNRVVFPIYMSHQLVGWQARYIGTADWKYVPKYWGMPGMHKRAMLYNYDNASRSNCVVLVEGPTDVHAVGDSAVAVLGKTVSYIQMNMLLNTWANKPILVVLDPDATKESDATVQELRDNNAIVVDVRLPGNKDCGDFDRQTLWNIFNARAREVGLTLSPIF